MSAARTSSQFDPLEAAQRRHQDRVPWWVNHSQVGSVARAHLPWLREYAPWLVCTDEAVILRLPEPERSEALNAVHRQLRDHGLLVGWRDEIFPLWDAHTGAVLAHIERSAARFWGSLTRGAHCNGYVANAQGRPERLWVARRSPHKSTDPLCLDNLVGGGVPLGQTPREALVREAWEEAGLLPEQLSAATAHGILEMHRDVSEGRQWEWLYTFDLPLSPQVHPRNQDGEVMEFTCVGPTQLLEMIYSAEMTVDAAVVSLDFAHRHGWVPEHLRAEISTQLAQLLRTPACTPLRA